MAIESRVVIRIDANGSAAIESINGVDKSLDKLKNDTNTGTQEMGMAWVKFAGAIFVVQQGISAVANLIKTAIEPSSKMEVVTAHYTTRFFIICKTKS
jgi:hypothetical protein